MTSPMRARSAPDRGHREQRTRRSGVGRIAAWPGAVLVYAMGTFGAEGRVLMLAIVASMAVVLGALWWMAARAGVPGRRIAADQIAVVVVVLGLSGLLLVEGGVATPLGALMVYALLYFGATEPVRLFAVVVTIGGTVYGLVAVIGDPAPQGYAATMMIGAVGIGFLCRRHASALTALRRRLTELSTIDPLTGCLNRRGFDEQFARELAQANRTGDTVTLVLVDLDRFKEVNDTLGHAAGDDLLAWVGRALAGAVRAHDSVGRIGGDEFAVLLVNTAADAASTAVSRLRDSLDAVTPASFGSATAPVDGTAIPDLKHCADARLYEDKGRRGEPRPVPSRTEIEAAHIGERPDSTSTTGLGRADRVRRTVLALGLLCTFDFVTGLFYVYVLAPDRPNRLAITAGLLFGAACGLGEVAFAGRIARSRWADAVMGGLAVPQFVAGAAVVLLDGGVLSPMAAGLVAPLPMVAYGSPPRRTAPIVAVVLLGYLGIGVIGGGVSGWYLAMYVAGSLALVVACGQLGEEATRQRRRLSELTRADVMTGCLNRRGFEERFTAELAHAHRSDRPMALLLLDLDGFKQVNDTLGHAAGDELLVWVATTLEGALHPHDAVGRLGGDEFAVLLTAELPEPEDDVVERLRVTLAARTAASMGLAHLGVDGDDLDTLYAVADERLYAEKRGAAPRRPTPSRRIDPVVPEVAAEPV